MGIQNWSEEIILVELLQEPLMGDELNAVSEIVRDSGECDVVIDFSSVDILTSSSISKLLKIQKMLKDCSQKLVFCHVAPATKSIFTITGIDEIFDFVDDKFIALASLQLTAQNTE